MSGKKTTLIQGAGVAVAVAIVIFVARFVADSPTSLRGAVVTANTIPARELPLAAVEITLADDPAAPAVHSDNSGYFTLPIPWRQRVRRSLPISLAFRLPGYQPLELSGVAPDKLCVAHLTPLSQPAQNRPAVNIANVVAKYSISTTTMINIGSAVRLFPVVNAGNVPCQEHYPCSPDGRWKAAIGSTMLDAGKGNEFRNARASCIAGPCPFTKIVNSNLANPGQTLHVSALDWSDTTTFLVEAEVYRAAQTDVLRDSYPLIFGQALTFTLPAAAQGVSIQAEVDKAAVVFPLGPALLLSWADCQLQINKDQTKVYRCELKAGYKFS